jgi:hypothetical protein
MFRMLSIDNSKKERKNSRTVAKNPLSQAQKSCPKFPYLLLVTKNYPTHFRSFFARPPFLNRIFFGVFVWRKGGRKSLVIGNQIRLLSTRGFDYLRGMDSFCIQVYFWTLVACLNSIFWSVHFLVEFCL